MKIIAYSLILFLIASVQTTKAQQATGTSALVTLNGYTFKEAETMVKNFQSSPSSSHSRTSFWFSKAYVNNLARILPAENIDGIRIYFSKDRGNNNIVIVATRAKKDVFSFTSDYFKPGAAELRGLVEYNAPEARLYDVAEGECSGTVCSTDSKQVLSCAEGKRRISAVETGGIKTTSVWFPIDLIEHLSNELNSTKKVNEETDGIRIYYAKKDDEYHNFVIATTRKYEGRSRTDYYECSMLLKKSGEGEGEDGDDDGGMVYDNGEECPNICNGVTWP